MRVVSGSAKGRRLRAPRGPATRPTADHVRQAIFDILGTVAEARVLDLFAGSGAMGIEALSRGAKTALFVETTREACEAISDNLERTRTAAQATVRRADVGRVVARPAPHPFELVLIDPPYERGLGFVDRILENLLLGGWIAERGTVVVEAELGSVGWPEGLHETRTRIFGRTQVSVAMRHE